MVFNFILFRQCFYTPTVMMARIVMVVIMMAQFQVFTLKPA